jgi:AcrR family transcriptional regulator
MVRRETIADPLDHPAGSPVGLRVADRRRRRLVGQGPGDRESAPAAAAFCADPELIGPQTPLPVRSARSEPIRTRLLDAAELLFARWGYTGVSIRDVTDIAEMRLGNVTYYFGSKQNLYFEVLRRRAEPLARARTEALAPVRESVLNGGDFIDAVVDAYLDPALSLAMAGGPGWRNFFRLIGQVTYSGLWPDALARYFNVPAAAFIDALRGRFPAATDFQLQSAMLMMISPSMYTLARTGRVETFAQPAFASDDLDRLGPQTKRFIQGGLKALFLPR